MGGIPRADKDRPSATLPAFRPFAIGTAEEFDLDDGDVRLVVRDRVVVSEP